MLQPATITVFQVPSRRTRASPSVRRYARELGVRLEHVTPGGANERITHADVAAYIKAALASGIVPGVPAPTGHAGNRVNLELQRWPQADFSHHGMIEARPVAHAYRIAAAQLARDRAMIPRVTNFDQADITDLEDFRIRTNREARPADPRMTLTALVLKACAASLQDFPDFNASFEAGDGNPRLVHKKYCHIGFTVGTPNGLLIPVLRDVDRKSVGEIARATAELACKARDGTLQGSDTIGATFTLSNLGGMGGTAFAPPIDAPQVASLGISRALTRPVADGRGGFAPRLVLPLSLSWDHRVIDGAGAARFLVHLATALSHFKPILREV